MKVEARHRASAGRSVRADDFVAGWQSYAARSIRAVTLAAAWLTVGTIGALALLGMVIADHTCPGGLPEESRVLLRWFWLGGLAIGAALVARAVIARRLNPLFVARALERAADLGFQPVVSALLLRRTGRPAFAATAAEVQAALALAQQPPIRRVRAETGRMPRILLVVTLVGWAGYAALAPKSVWTSLARIFGARWAAPAATHLTLVRPGPDDIVRAGQPLDVIIACHGRRVSAGRLELLDQDGRPIARHDAPNAWHEDARGPALRFPLPPLEVAHDLHFRCTAGDAVLTGEIAVQPTPTLDRLEVTVQPPAYTQQAARVAPDPNLDVLSGSAVTFRLIANVPPREPVLVFNAEHEARTRMRVSTASPHEALAELVLTRSGTYGFEFADAWGAAYRAPGGYRAQVRDDAPPAIHCLVPPPRQRPAGVVDLAVHDDLVALATDDVGVTELDLVIERAASTERLSLGRWAAPGRGRETASILASKLNIAVGETRPAWFEARDARVLPDGSAAPQVSRSATFLLTRSAAASQPAPLGDVPDAESSGEHGRSAEGGTRPASQPGESSTTTAPSESEPGGQDQADPHSSPTDGESPDGAVPSENEPDSQEPTRPDASGDAEHAAAGTQEEPAGESDSEANADGATTAPSSQPSQNEGGDTQREMDEFQRRHGGDLRRIVERMRAADGAAGDEPGGTDSEPAAPQPAPASQPAEPGDAPNAPPPGQSRPPDQVTGRETPQPESPDASGGTSSGPPTSQPTPPGEAGGTPGGGAQRDSGTPPTAATQPASEDDPYERPPTGDVVKGALPDTGRAENTDLIELLRRADEIEPSDLEALGWSPQDAAAFVRDLRRLRDSVQAAAERGDPLITESDFAAAESDIQPGASPTAEMGRQIEGAAMSPDDIPSAAPDAEPQVPAALQALLDEYYRSLARYGLGEPED